MPLPTLETSYRRRWLVLATLCLSVLLVVLANMALNVALPSLGRDLHAGTTSLAWVVDSYVLCFAAFLLPAGAIGDRFGRKGVLQCGLLIFGAAAVAAASSSTVGELVAARAVMGFGAALVMPGTLAILATVFPPAERAQAIAIWASVAGGSVAVSIVWSGFVLEHFWWGAIFLSMALLALVTLVTGWFLLPTSRQANAARLDPVGVALSILATAGLLYAFIQAPDDGWRSPTILVAFGLGAAGLVAFVAWERSRTDPMLTLTFFADFRFSLGTFSIAGAYFALFGTYFLLTQYLQLVRGFSPLVAGAAALPAGLAQFATAQLGRPLVPRLGFPRVLAGGLLASAAGLALLAGTQPSSPLWIVECGLGLLGAGVGLAMPPASGAIMASLPADQAGVGSAVNDLSRELGGAFGIGVLGSVALTRSRALLAPHLSGLSPSSRTAASAGLAPALALAHGAHRIFAALARRSFCSGFELAMLTGASLLVVAAGIVALKGSTRTSSVLADPVTHERTVTHDDAHERSPALRPGACPETTGPRRSLSSAGRQVGTEA